jgi:hypothetical protein
MKLKPAVFIGSIALLLTASGALAQDAARKAKIEEMFRLMNIDQMMQQMMGQMKAMGMQQLDKNMPPEEKAKAAESQRKIFDMFNWEKFKSSFVQIYSEVYTDEELDGILAFYRSPAGQAMVAKQPQLMAKSMALAQKLMADMQPELEKMRKEPAATDQK